MLHTATRSEFKLLIVLSLVVAFTTGCGKSFLYLGSSVPAIEIFDITPGSGGAPQMIRLQGGPALTIGNPFAMTVVGKTLYVAGGGGSVGQFTIDPSNGALTLRGTIPAGSPPYSMVATKTAVYVANHGSNNISVYSIDSSGNLTNVQTAAVNGISTLQLDGTPGKFLFTGARASGTTGSQACTHTIQANGSLGATPNCVAVPGAPDSIQVSGGVLYLRFNAIVPPSPGNSNFVSAWNVDPATGVLTHRGMDLDIGAANALGMAASTNGQTLFIPRQGGFTTVGTANPLTSGMVPYLPTNGSRFCLANQVGPGQVLADPAGKAIYVTDTIGDASPTANPPGPRVSVIDTTTAGGFKQVLCDSAGRLPQSMAMFIP